MTIVKKAKQMLVRKGTKGNFRHHWWEYTPVVTVEDGVAGSRREKTTMYRPL